ncbi:MAG: hypothetical protein K0S07_168 [Chlamydiales bacterium]|nr:hypothetical protein [Chlamydiales bacterium]
MSPIGVFHSQEMGLARRLERKSSDPGLPRLIYDHGESKEPPALSDRARPLKRSQSAGSSLQRAFQLSTESLVEGTRKPVVLFKDVPATPSFSLAISQGQESLAIALLDHGVEVPDSIGGQDALVFALHFHLFSLAKKMVALQPERMNFSSLTYLLWCLVDGSAPYTQYLEVIRLFPMHIPFYGWNWGRPLFRSIWEKYGKKDLAFLTQQLIERGIDVRAQIEEEQRLEAIRDAMLEDAALIQEEESDLFEERHGASLEALVAGSHFPVLASLFKSPLLSHYLCTHFYQEMHLFCQRTVISAFSLEERLNLLPLFSPSEIQEIIQTAPDLLVQQRLSAWVQYEGEAMPIRALLEDLLSDYLYEEEDAAAWAASLLPSAVALALREPQILEKVAFHLPAYLHVLDPLSLSCLIPVLPDKLWLELMRQEGKEIFLRYATLSQKELFLEKIGLAFHIPVFALWQKNMPALQAIVKCQGRELADAWSYWHALFLMPLCRGAILLKRLQQGLCEKECPLSFALKIEEALAPLQQGLLQIQHWFDEIKRSLPEPSAWAKNSSI